MAKLYKYVYHNTDKVYAVFDIVDATDFAPIRYLSLALGNDPINVYACNNLSEIVNDYIQISWDEFKVAYNPNLDSIIERLYPKG